MYQIFKVEYKDTDEKFNQMEDENVSDTSEKSKANQNNSDKKDSKKESDSGSSTPAPSGSKVETKEEEHHSDHEDPHSKIPFSIYNFVDLVYLELIFNVFLLYEFSLITLYVQLKNC